MKILQKERKKKNADRDGDFDGSTRMKCQKTSVLHSIKIAEMRSRKQKMKMRGFMFILYSTLKRKLAEFKHDEITRKIKI